MFSFYETLATALNQAGKHVRLFGDFNAQIGQTNITDNLVFGKYGYGKRSERGEKLVQFAVENKLSKEKKSRKSFKSQAKSLKTTADINSYLKNLEQNIKEFNTRDGGQDVQNFYNILENIINKSMTSKQKELKIDTVMKILRKETVDMLSKRTELVKTKHKTKIIKEDLSDLIQKNKQSH
ncbi:unnamed protein product [Leptidea sinapis]|uniref:Endonuclease/exonuclease/phosphatase domain-containing protein n=1 Tax=Leptidea sinapis TaxID=189913 RepID=A0A5E4PXG1_9NEOP|nr:unnamed protein product [Leptidea sinapis]